MAENFETPAQNGDGDGENSLVTPDYASLNLLSEGEEGENLDIDDLLGSGLLSALAASVAVDYSSLEMPDNIKSYVDIQDWHAWNILQSTTLTTSSNTFNISNLIGDSYWSASSDITLSGTIKGIGAEDNFYFFSAYAVTLNGIFFDGVESITIRASTITFNGINYYDGVMTVSALGEIKFTNDSILSTHESTNLDKSVLNIASSEKITIESATLKNQVGSIHLVAPQIVINNSTITAKGDITAFAVVNAGVHAIFSALPIKISVSSVSIHVTNSTLTAGNDIKLNASITTTPFMQHMDIAEMTGIGGLQGIDLFLKFAPLNFFQDWLGLSFNVVQEAGDIGKTLKFIPYVGDVAAWLDVLSHPLGDTLEQLFKSVNIGGPFIFGYFSADATITLDGTTTLTATKGDVVVKAQSTMNGVLQTINNLFAVAIGFTDISANVRLADTVNITAGRDIIVKATTADNFAVTAIAPYASNGSIAKDGFDLAFALAINSSSANIDIAMGVIMNAGRDIVVRGEATGNQVVSASTNAGVTANLSTVAALHFGGAHSSVIVDGNLTADGSVLMQAETNLAITTNASNVNLPLDTITSTANKALDPIKEKLAEIAKKANAALNKVIIGLMSVPLGAVAHSLQKSDGELGIVIGVGANNASSLARLGTHAVITAKGVKESGTISEWGKVELSSVSVVLPTLTVTSGTEAGNPGELDRKIEIRGGSDIQASNGEARFNVAHHGLQVGDIVTYTALSDPLSGMVNGASYKVAVAVNGENGYFILETLDSKKIDISKNDAALHLGHLFKYSVVDRPSVLVEPARITKEGTSNDYTVFNVINTFRAGEQVKYSFSGGSAIGGLENGHVYTILSATADSFTLCDANGQVLVLDPSKATTQTGHSFSRVGGLLDRGELTVSGANLQGVDNDSGWFYLPPKVEPPFAVGNKITYSVADGGTALGELVVGETYIVVEMKQYEKTVDGKKVTGWSFTLASINEDGTKGDTIIPNFQQGSDSYHIFTNTAMKKGTNIAAGASVLFNDATTEVLSGAKIYAFDNVTISSEAKYVLSNGKNTKIQINFDDSKAIEQGANALDIGWIKSMLGGITGLMKSLDKELLDNQNYIADFFGLDTYNFNKGFAANTNIGASVTGATESALGITVGVILNTNHATTTVGAGVVIEQATGELDRDLTVGGDYSDYNEEPKTILTFELAHGFVTGDIVLYRPDTKEDFGGLKDGTMYMVLSRTATSLSLREVTQNLDEDDEWDGTWTIGKDIVFGAILDGGISMLVKVPDTMREGMVIAFTGAEFAANNTGIIHQPLAGFKNGDIVVYKVSAGGTALAGLTDGETYTLIKYNETMFGLQVLLSNGEMGNIIYMGVEFDEDGKIVDDDGASAAAFIASLTGSHTFVLASGINPNGTLKDDAPSLTFAKDDVSVVNGYFVISLRQNVYSIPGLDSLALKEADVVKFSTTGTVPTGLENGAYYQIQKHQNGTISFLLGSYNASTQVFTPTLGADGKPIAVLLNAQDFRAEGVAASTFTLELVATAQTRGNVVVDNPNVANDETYLPIGLNNFIDGEEVTLTKVNVKADGELEYIVVGTFSIERVDSSTIRLKYFDENDGSTALYYKMPFGDSEQAYQLVSVANSNIHALFSQGSIDLARCKIVQSNPHGLANNEMVTIGTKEYQVTTHGQNAFTLSEVTVVNNALVYRMVSLQELFSGIDGYASLSIRRGVQAFIMDSSKAHASATGAAYITKANHGLATGAVLEFHTATGVETYYAVVKDKDNFYLAESLAEALQGVCIVEKLPLGMDGNADDLKKAAPKIGIFVSSNAVDQSVNLIGKFSNGAARKNYNAPWSFADLVKSPIEGVKHQARMFTDGRGESAASAAGLTIFGQVAYNTSLTEIGKGATDNTTTSITGTHLNVYASNQSGALSLVLASGSSRLDGMSGILGGRVQYHNTQAILNVDKGNIIIANDLYVGAKDNSRYTTVLLGYSMGEKAMAGKIFAEVTVRDVNAQIIGRGAASGIVNIGGTIVVEAITTGQNIALVGGLAIAWTGIGTGTGEKEDTREYKYLDNGLLSYIANKINWVVDKAKTIDTILNNKIIQGLVVKIFGMTEGYGIFHKVDSKEYSTILGMVAEYGSLIQGGMKTFQDWLKTSQKAIEGAQENPGGGQEQEQKESVLSTTNLDIYFQFNNYTTKAIVQNLATLVVAGFLAQARNDTKQIAAMGSFGVSISSKDTEKKSSAKAGDVGAYFTCRNVAASVENIGNFVVTENNAEIFAKDTSLTVLVGAGVAVSNTGTSFGGTALLNIRKSNVTANMLNTNLDVQQGALKVEAFNDSRIITVAGGGGFSDTAGRGFSLSVNVITGDTKAYIEGGSLKVSKNIDVLATRGTAQEDTQRDADGIPIFDGLQSKLNIISIGASAGVGFSGDSMAGSLVANLVFGDVGAWIKGLNSLNMNVQTDGDVNVVAKDQFGILAIGGSLGVSAKAKQDNPDAAQTSAVGFNVNANMVNTSSKAALDHVMVRSYTGGDGSIAKNVYVGAHTLQHILAIAGAIAVNTSKGGSATSFTLGFNMLNGAARATVSSSDILATTLKVHGSEEGDILAIAGGVSVSTGKNFATAIAFNMMLDSSLPRLEGNVSPDKWNELIKGSETVKGASAEVLDSKITLAGIADDKAAMNVLAESSAQILAIAAGVGVSVGSAAAEAGEGQVATHGAAIAGSASINIIVRKVTASVLSSEITAALGGVSVVARDYIVKTIMEEGKPNVEKEFATSIISLSGQVGVGVNKGSQFGGAFAINVLDTQVLARLSKTTVDAGGDLALIAESKASIVNIVASVALTFKSEKSKAVSGAISINVINSSAVASLDGVKDGANKNYLAVDGNIHVKALDNASITTISLVGAVASGTTVGVSNTTSVINSTIHAGLHDFDSVGAGKGITVEALSSSRITSIAAGVAGSTGDGLAFGLNLSESIISRDIRAELANIRLATVTGDVFVRAQELAPSKLDWRKDCWWAKNLKIDSTGDVDNTQFETEQSPMSFNSGANSDKNFNINDALFNPANGIFTLVISLAASSEGNVGAGSLAFNWLSRNVVATMHDIGTMNITSGDVAVTAQSTSSAFAAALSGAGSISGNSGGAAASMAVNVMDNQVQALIDNCSITNAHDVTVSAKGAAGAIAVAASVGLGSVGVGATLTANMGIETLKRMFASPTKDKPDNNHAMASSVYNEFKKDGVTKFLNDDTIGDIDTLQGGNAAKTPKLGGESARASVSNSAITSSGKLFVESTQASGFISVNLSMGIGADKVGVAAGIALNFVNTDSHAIVSNSTVIASQGGKIDSKLAGSAVAIQVAAGASPSVGVAVILSVSMALGDATALMQGGSFKSTSNGLYVNAESTFNVVTVGISVGIGVDIAGVTVSVAIAVAGANVTSMVDGTHVDASNQAIDILASNKSNTITLGIGAAFGGSGGVAVGIAVNVSNWKHLRVYDPGTAQKKDTAEWIKLAGGQVLGNGAFDTLASFSGDGTMGAVAVSAESTALFRTTYILVGVGSTGSAGFALMMNLVDSSSVAIFEARNDTTASSIQVHSTNKNSMHSSIVAVAGAGIGDGALSCAVNAGLVTSTASVSALGGIANEPVVNLNVGGAVDVKAVSELDIYALAIIVAGTGIGAGALALSVNTVEAGAYARLGQIGRTFKLNAGGAVNVEAINDSTITSGTLAVAGAGAGAGALALSINVSSRAALQSIGVNAVNNAEGTNTLGHLSENTVYSAKIEGDTIRLLDKDGHNITIGTTGVQNTKHYFVITDENGNERMYMAYLEDIAADGTIKTLRDMDGNALSSLPFFVQGKDTFTYRSSTLGAGVHVDEKLIKESVSSYALVQGVTIPNAASLTVNASSKRQTLILAASVAAAGAGAGGGGIAIFVGRDTTKAAVNDSIVTTLTTGDVSVTATNKSFVGSLGIGVGAAGKFGLGAVVTVINDKGDTVAHVKNSSIEARNVTVASTIERNVLSIGIAGAGAGGVAIGASVSVALVSAQTNALLENSSIKAHGNVNITALMGSGAAVALKDLSKSTAPHADFLTEMDGYFNQSSITSLEKHLNDTAKNTNDTAKTMDGKDLAAKPATVKLENNGIIAINIALAGSGVFAGAGALVVASFEGQVKASAESTAPTPLLIDAQGNINVNAANNIKIFSLVISAGLTVAPAAGVTVTLSIATASISGDCLAQIGNMKLVSHAGSISISAKREVAVSSILVAASVAINGTTTFPAISVNAGIVHNSISGKAGAYVTNAEIQSYAKDIGISAQNLVTCNSYAFGVSVSITLLSYAAGGALTVNKLDSVTEALVTNSKLKSDLGKIDITASEKVMAYALAVQGSLAAGALAFARASVTSSGKVTAYTHGGSLFASGDINIHAESWVNIYSSAIGVSIGAISIGVALAYAHIDSDAKVDAHVVGTDIQKASKIAVLSDARWIAQTTGIAGAGGLAAGGAGSRADSVVDGTVSAYMKDAKLGDVTDVDIHAKATPYLYTYALAPTVGGAVSVGVAISDAVLGLKIHAYGENLTNTTNTKPNLNIKVEQMKSAQEGGNIYSESWGGFAVGLVGVEGALAWATVKNSEVKAWLAGGTENLHLASLNVEAIQNTGVLCEAYGIALGGVAVGVMRGVTDIENTTNAYIDKKSGLVVTGNIDISAKAETRTDAEVISGSGGVLAVAISTTKTTLKSNVSSWIGDANIIDAGTLSMLATNKVYGAQDNRMGSAGVVGGTGTDAIYNVTLNTQALIGKNAKITAQDIAMLSFNDVGIANKSNTHGYAAITFSGINSLMNITANSKVVIDEGAILTATGSRPVSNAARLSLEAYNTVNVRDEMGFQSGSLVGENNIDVFTTANTAAEVYVNKNAKLLASNLNMADILINAATEEKYTMIVGANIGGLASIGGMKTMQTITNKDRIVTGESVNMYSTGKVTMNAGEVWNKDAGRLGSVHVIKAAALFGVVNVKVDSHYYEYVLAPMTKFTAPVKADQDNIIIIDKNADIKARGDITLNAFADFIVDITALNHYSFNTKPVEEIAIKAANAVQLAGNVTANVDNSISVEIRDISYFTQESWNKAKEDGLISAAEIERVEGAMALFHARYGIDFFAYQVELLAGNNSSLTDAFFSASRELLADPNTNFAYIITYFSKAENEAERKVFFSDIEWDAIKIWFNGNLNDIGNVSATSFNTTQWTSLLNDTAVRAVLDVILSATALNLDNLQSLTDAYWTAFKASTSMDTFLASFMADKKILSTWYIENAMGKDPSEITVTSEDWDAWLANDRVKAILQNLLGGDFENATYDNLTAEFWTAFVEVANTLGSVTSWYFDQYAKPETKANTEMTREVWNALLGDATAKTLLQNILTSIPTESLQTLANPATLSKDFWAALAASEDMAHLLGDANTATATNARLALSLGVFMRPPSETMMAGALTDFGVLSYKLLDRYVADQLAEGTDPKIMTELTHIVVGKNADRMDIVLGDVESTGTSALVTEYKNYQAILNTYGKDSPMSASVHAQMKELEPKLVELGLGLYRVVDASKKDANGDPIKEFILLESSSETVSQVTVKNVNLERGSVYVNTDQITGYNGVAGMFTVSDASFIHIDYYFTKADLVVENIKVSTQGGQLVLNAKQVSGVAYTKPAKEPDLAIVQHVEGRSLTAREVYNLLGLVKIHTEGDLIIDGTIAGKTQDIFSKGMLSISGQTSAEGSGSFYNVGGLPASVTTDGSGNPVITGITKQGMLVALSDIKITADYINVNGLIQSGVAKIIGTYNSSNVHVATHINAQGELVLGYDFADGTATFHSAYARGGNIILNGEVINTNAGLGKIVIYTNPDVTITNTVNGVNIALNTIDTGQSVVGTITIANIKTVKNEDGSYSKAKIVESLALGELMKLDPSLTSWTPNSAIRFHAQSGRDFTTRATYTYVTKALFGSDALWPDTSQWNYKGVQKAEYRAMNATGGYFTTMDAEAVQSKLAGYTVEQHAIDTATTGLTGVYYTYTLTLGKQENVSHTYREWGWWYFKYSEATYTKVITTGKQDVVWMIIEANNAITLQHGDNTAHGTGKITVSNTGGSVTILGNLTANGSSGDISVTAQNGIYGGNLTATGAITLNSNTGNIGTESTRVSVQPGAGKSVIVTATSGAVYLASTAENLQVNVTNAMTANIAAQGTLNGAIVAQTAVLSARMGIGTYETPLTVNGVAGVNGGLITLTAVSTAANIYISSTSDIGVGKIATQGDITLKTTKSLIDAEKSVKQDTDAADSKDMQDLWKDLGILGEGSDWTVADLVGISQAQGTGLNVAQEIANIQGKKVILEAGVNIGWLGDTGVPADSIVITDYAAKLAGATLTLEEQYLLSTANERDLVMVGSDLHVRRNENLNVYLHDGGSLTFSAGGFALIGTGGTTLDNANNVALRINSGTAYSEIRLAATGDITQEAAVTQGLFVGSGGGHVTIVSANGSIGTKDSALLINVQSTIDVRARSKVFLHSKDNDIRFSNLYALGGIVSTAWVHGIIYERALNISLDEDLTFNAYNIRIESTAGDVDVNATLNAERNISVKAD